MIRLKFRNIIKFSMVPLLLHASLSWPWGKDAHQIINREAIKLMASPLDEFFSAYRDSIIALADAPDTWAKENPELKNRHYIDLDLLDKYPFDTIPRDFIERIFIQ